MARPGGIWFAATACDPPTLGTALSNSQPDVMRCRSTGVVQERSLLESVDVRATVQAPTVS